MRAKADMIVCVCLLMVVYVNWTSVPPKNREVRGTLVRLEVQNANN